MAVPPRVFISYSHDNPAHEEWVCRLAVRLRENGVDIILDQWDLRPGDSVPAFMESAVGGADRVLVICTDAYVQKADGSRSGVGYEKMVITAELLESSATSKFIPVIRGLSSGRKVPRCLADRMYVDFSDDESFDVQLDKLLRAIHGVSRPARPALGPSPFTETPGRRMTESLLDRMNALYRARRDGTHTQYWSAIQQVYCDFEAIHERYVASFRRIHAATREPGATLDEIIAFCREEYLFSETQRSKLRELVAAGLDAVHHVPFPDRWTPPAKDASGFPVRFFCRIEYYLTAVQATRPGEWELSQRHYHALIDQLCGFKTSTADPTSERRLLDAARVAVENLIGELNRCYGEITREYFDLATTSEESR